MKPLEKGRRVLSWIGIKFKDEEAPVTCEQRFFRVTCPFIFRTVCIAIFVVHVITLLSVRFSDTEEYFYVLMQFVFTIHASSSFITLISCSRISIMFEGLTEIYEKYPNESLTKLNAKFEWVYEHVFNAMMKWHAVALVVPSLISVFLCYLRFGKFDVSHLYWILKVRLPWDQTTPIGYFGEICFSLLNVEAFWVVGGQILLLFVFICRNNFVFTEMFQSYLKEFEQSESTQEKHEIIRKIIAFHTDIKRFFDETRSTFSYSFASMFFWSIIALASCLFIFHVKEENFDVETLTLISVAITNPSWMFLHCYLGVLVTDKYEQFSEHLYEVEWFTLPPGLQKYFILMLANTQKPLFFDGLGIYVLDLEAFATSMNHVYFYSMIFRSIVEPGDEIHVMHLEIL